MEFLNAHQSITILPRLATCNDLSTRHRYKTLNVFLPIYRKSWDIRSSRLKLCSCDYLSFHILCINFLSKYNNLNEFIRLDIDAPKARVYRPEMSLIIFMFRTEL